MDHVRLLGKKNIGIVEEDGLTPGCCTDQILDFNCA